MDTFELYNLIGPLEHPSFLFDGKTRKTIKDGEQSDLYKLLTERGP